MTQDQKRKEEIGMDRVVVAVGNVPDGKEFIASGRTFCQMSRDGDIVVSRLVKPHALVVTDFPGTMIAWDADNEVEVDQEKWNDWVARGLISEGSIIGTAYYPEE